VRPTFTVSGSAVVPVPAERVYAIIADYRNGHPRILPPQFLGLTVEKGGVGDGTIIRFQTRVMGRTQSFRAAITEPEPGRVLVETDLDSNGAVTTFTVDRLPDRRQSKVEISTRFPSRPGLMGKIERAITTRVAEKMYKQELQILTDILSRDQRERCVPTSQMQSQRRPDR
jgi:hypothetical protein